MPVISKFYGIIIKIYFQQKEHNPPHIHVIYGEQSGAVNILTNELMYGDLPPKAQAMVNEWIDLHREELLEIWNTQYFVTLPPLA